MKTKTFLLTAIAAMMLFACSNKNEFVINGHIEGEAPAEVYLQKSKDGKFEIIDTAKVENGNFAFKGEIQIPDLYYIALNDQLYIPFFNEAGKITINFHVDSLKNPRVSGSASDQEFRNYLKLIDGHRSALMEVYSKFTEANSAGDTVTMTLLEEKLDNMQKDQMAEIREYIRANSKSFVAPYVAMRQAYDMELSEMEDVLASFDPGVKESPFAKMLADRIEILQNVAIGKTAPEFTMNNPEGEPVSLSQFRGKVLLVDFWAAWCGPCRAENPNVVAAYNKYHDKGFDVLGVSLDREKEAWLKAIADDHLTWTHVSDLQFWQNAAAKLYGISAIPSNVLLDRDGVIIGRNLRGKELQDKLAEIFAEV